MSGLREAPREILRGRRPRGTGMVRESRELVRETETAREARGVIREAGTAREAIREPGTVREAREAIREAGTVREAREAIREAGTAREAREAIREAGTAREVRKAIRGTGTAREAREAIRGTGIVREVMVRGPREVTARELRVAMVAAEVRIRTEIHEAIRVTAVVQEHAIQNHPLTLPFRQSQPATVKIKTLTKMTALIREIG